MYDIVIIGAGVSGTSIARELAKRYNITMTEDMIEKEAVKWELGHGGRSGRTAQQFINHLIGISE